MTPTFLIENGYLEKLEDFEYQGRQVLASRLGYRITALFADHFLGRLFETPDAVFTREMLCPEEQDPDAFAVGIDAVVASQREVARSYFADGSIAGACPPLRALLHIMAEGHFEGLTAGSPELKAMFSRESLLESQWYAERLREKQQRDIALWERHTAAAEGALRARQTHRPGRNGNSPEALVELTRRKLAEVQSSAYIESLKGTIGADPFGGQFGRQA
jgi:hypothetical protein